MVARVEEHLSEPAACLIAGRMVLSGGQCKEQWTVRHLAFFLFEGICDEHHKGQQLQAQEDRASNRQPAGPCWFDFGWW